MKSGILKLMLLSIPLVPLIVQAATDTGTAETQTWKIEKKPAATFDSGESEGEGTGAKLRTDQQISDDASGSAATVSSTSSSDASTSQLSYEPGVNRPPRTAKKAKKPSKTTYRTSIETAYRPASLDKVDKEEKTEKAAVAEVTPTHSEKKPTASIASTASASTSQETESGSTGTKLRSGHQNKEDSSASSVSTSTISITASSPATPPAKKPRKTIAKTTYRTSIETAYRPAVFDPPIAAEVAPSHLALDAKAHWKIHSGERISDVMTRWTKVIGWQLTWEPEDMIAMADLDLEDTFMDATTKVIDALNRNGADMQAKFYASNHMLRITVRK